MGKIKQRVKEGWSFSVAVGLTEKMRSEHRIEGDENEL